MKRALVLGIIVAARTAAADPSTEARDSTTKPKAKAPANARPAAPLAGPDNLVADAPDDPAAVDKTNDPDATAPPPSPPATPPAINPISATNTVTSTESAPGTTKA
ncbi:MAG TPA: hypothetical protein VGO00_18100, partial [Kofleriaceae bacterium]|nr:hypothetical protein [Kofleriaceae bacterium]